MAENVPFNDPDVPQSMQDSLLRQITIPDVLSTRNPAPIVYATTKPVRVVVRNSGAALLFLGFAAQDVAPAAGGGATTAAYRLPPGAADVFVLAPKQILFAAAAGPGGLASMHVSEAFPFVAG